MADKGNEHVLFKVFIQISRPNIISLDQEEYQRIIRYTKNIGSRETTRYEENDWKQWLRCFEQYNISPEIWSRINPQNWRNRVSKQCTCYEE
jgi:hypothetical protein